MPLSGFCLVGVFDPEAISNMSDPLVSLVRQPGWARALPVLKSAVTLLPRRAVTLTKLPVIDVIRSCDLLLQYAPKNEFIVAIRKRVIYRFGMGSVSDHWVKKWNLRLFLRNLLRSTAATAVREPEGEQLGECLPLTFPDRAVPIDPSRSTCPNRHILINTSQSTDSIRVARLPAL
jgi:hypothetical protein